jgi:cystine transport system substrate-binding protein
VRERTKLHGRPSIRYLRKHAVFSAWTRLPPPELWYGPPLVLGQAHTPRRRLLPLAALAFAVLVAPAFGGANATHHLATLRAQDAQIEARSRSAALSLYALDHRLAEANAQLQSLHQRSQSLESARRLLQLQIRIARRSTAIAQRSLAQRLRTLYEEGDVEPIEIVFGSKNLDDAMANLDNLSRMSQEGEDDLAALRSAKAQLAGAASDLARQEAALAAATRAAQASAVALTQTRAQRSAYLASLATQHRMTRSAIASAIASARAAQVRTTVVAHDSAPVGGAVSSIQPKTVAAGRSITVVATGYSLGGRTATGLPVGWGVAAVDPSVIPLGTHMTVPGYGEAVAADIGGAIRGGVVDLWFPTVAQANGWGRRSVTVVLH